MPDITTDDIYEYYEADGFEPAIYQEIFRNFNLDNGYKKYGKDHNAFSLYAADHNYMPARDGANKGFYTKKYKINTNIKTKAGDEKQQRLTRLRVIKALETKMEKRIAKDNRKRVQNEKKEKSKRKDIFKVGCAFRGIGYIKEYEDDMIYIPPSDYCLIRCVEKAMGIKIDTKGLNPYGNSLTKLRMSIKNVIEIDNIPSIITIDFNFKKNIIVDVYEDIKEIDEEEELFEVLDDIESGRNYEQENNNEIIKTFTPINRGKQKDEKFKILLCRLNSNEYHAILIKINDDEIINQKFYRQRHEHIFNNIDYVQNLDLSDDQIKLRLPKYKKMINECFVFDIETSSKSEKIIQKFKDENGNEIEKEIETREQIPEGVAYAELDFKTMTYKKVARCIGDNCYKSFLNHISKKTESDTILLFSHNGGCFDNLYAKGLKTLTLKKQIKSGRVKMIEAIHKTSGKTLIFLDSLSFLKSSLDEACDFFKIKNKKMKFDIVNKDHDFFINTTEWKDYMKQDVVVLAEILLKFEQMIRSFGESITTSMCGISSMAWNLLCNRSFGMKKVYRSKDPTTQQFINDSVYGGRIIHGKKIFDSMKDKSEGLICLDGNSLHPSAMFIADYPIGKFRVMNDINNLKVLKDKYLNKLLFIAEVTLDAGNVRYPLIPYRTEEGCIIYPNGVFTGVYTSVDLEEAVNDGYKIISFKRGIYWLSSKRIFANTINDLYEKRKELQKEENSMEYVYKIMMNSIYGYMTLSIDNSTIFSNEKNPKVNGGKITSTHLLKNGQYEHNISFRHPLIEKPAHIGAFILSNSRKIMNNYIRQIGPENIWYGDTDSLYVPIECIKSIKESEDLCGLKNDYGKGRLITHALFLDTKRYFLEFNNPDKKGNMYKAKFNGINFKDDKCLKNWIEGNDKKEKLKQMYEWFYNNPNKVLDIKIVQDVWNRNIDNVVINTVELGFQVSPDVRYNWNINESYPIKLNDSDDHITYDYNNTNFTVLGGQTKFTDQDPYLYEISQHGLYSAMPLTHDELHESKDLTINYAKEVLKYKEINNNFKTTFIKSKKTNQMYKRINNEFFMYDNTKPQEKISEEDIGECEELLIIPHSSFFPKLTSNDIDMILEGVEKCLKA